ncbi:zinc finger protein 845-like isoform X2 [Episyrphus balteatus]|uniref:zinc finger protein 845-like isoform X2 n=1 Tax=Episyrphus balteatus TaxID=286459 RepID=UPI002484FD45|nr:zinc finger protein 845-like isoform X2 [Episyrphus balteatus]
MNFNKICRICGEIIKDKHLETVDDNKTQIYKYLPDSDEEFPKNLCVDCLNLIDSWDVFYKRCEKSQKKFTALLKNKKTKKLIAKSKEKVSPLRNGNDKEITSVLQDHSGDEYTNKGTSKEATNGSFICNFCSVCTKGQPELNDHLIAVHCDLVFCCDLCKNYKPRDDLITHMTEHALSSLQSATPTKNHTTKTNNNNKLQCSKCDKQFTSNSGLKYHMNSNHNLAKQFPCDECHRVFPCKRVLLNHFRSVHSKDKPFKCNDCGKHFKTDSTLYAHRKTHSKEAPHKCFDCGKGFKFKHHLDSHALQHKTTKEKTFECSFCHKKFAALNNLTKHRKIHDNTSDFACHICGVKMMQKRYLKDHMKRVHQTRLD